MAPSAPTYIVGLGHSHGPHVIPSSFFDSLDIDSSSAWVEERTGIKSRTSVLSEETIRGIRSGQADHLALTHKGLIMTMAEFAEIPWKMATERAHQLGISTAPDTVISGSSIPDFDIPANACAIAARVNLNVTAFDVNSACSSFVTGLHVSRSLLQGGASKSIALFNVERYSTRMDFGDRSSCILFGDGAASTILVPTPIEGSFEILDTILASDPSGYDHVKIPTAGLFSQHGQVVQKFAITKTCSIAEEILARNSLTKGDVTYFVGHQANLRMLSAAVKKLGFDDDQHLYNVDRCGNQGAAGAPCVLSENWNRFRAGDLILIAVVGAGLTWGAALLRKT